MLHHTPINIRQGHSVPSILIAVDEPYVAYGLSALLKRRSCNVEGPFLDMAMLASLCAKRVPDICILGDIAELSPAIVTTVRAAFPECRIAGVDTRGLESTLSPISGGPMMALGIDGVLSSLMDDDRIVSALQLMLKPRPRFSDNRAVIYPSITDPSGPECPIGG